MIGIAEATEGVFKGVVKPILDKAFTDAKDRLDAELLAQRQIHEIILGQIETNKEEARNASTFVAGWRPFIGWMCGGTLAYIWVVRDMITYGIALTGSHVPPPPLVMTDHVFELTLAMLGFGALRTYEKIAGAAK